MNKNLAILIADLMYGDMGKGTITDSLCRQYKANTVVRYNGGPQAAHNVVTYDGKEHCFSQFGSGTLAGAKTFLSRFMLINPLAMDVEAELLKEKGIENPYAGMYIDEDCIIITPYHVALNKLREIIRGKNRHGSCGVGVGETRRMDIAYPNFTLRVKDISNLTYNGLFNKLKQIETYCASQIETPIYKTTTDEYVNFYKSWIKDVNIVTDKGKELIKDIIIFEGAQGVLLDEKHGFAPYNTWTNTTFANAETILSEIYFTGLIQKVGVTRTYATRHGAGPFVTEISNEEFMRNYPEEHNKTNDWQSNFRVGLLDIPALKLSIDILGGIDYLAVTHMDKLTAKNEIVVEYLRKKSGNRLLPLKEDSVSCPVFETNSLTEILMEDTITSSTYVSDDDFIPVIEKELNVKVAIESFGSKDCDKIHTLDLTKNPYYDILKTWTH